MSHVQEDLFIFSFTIIIEYSKGLKSEWWTVGEKYPLTTTPCAIRDNKSYKRNIVKKSIKILFKMYGRKNKILPNQGIKALGSWIGLKYLFSDKHIAKTI